MNRTPIRMGFLVGTAIVTCTGSARACESYDASLGTFPEDQGWVLTTDGPTTVTVTGGALNSSTLPFSDGACPAPNETQFINWRVDDAGLDFNDNPVLEARIHIHSSQYGSNTCTGWPRPGFLFLAADTNDRSYRVGLGSSRIFLANNGYIPFGDPGVVEADFDTTDGFHTYRLEMSGTMAVLMIDGVPTLSVGIGATRPASSTVAFGDPTVWANSDASVEWVTLTGSTCCQADIDGSGTVDVVDLIAVLAAWGPCPGCVEDIDGDGVVDVLDLLVILAGWGPCP